MHLYCFLPSGIPFAASSSILTQAVFVSTLASPLTGARFLRDCILRNLVRHEYETHLPSMEQIQDSIGYRPFRSKLDLTDGYHIRIHHDSVSDSTFTCHMSKFDSLVIQQGDCNAPATMMRAMNYLLREVKGQMIYLDDILIANHSYAEHINSIRQVLRVAKRNKLWFN